MRRISALFLLAVCSLVLCSCGSAQDPKPAKEASFSGVVLQLEDASVVVQPDPDDPLAKETDQVEDRPQRPVCPGTGASAPGGGRGGGVLHRPPWPRDPADPGRDPLPYGGRHRGMSASSRPCDLSSSG